MTTGDGRQTSTAGARGTLIGTTSGPQAARPEDGHVADDPHDVAEPEIADADDADEVDVVLSDLSDLWRGWVTPTDRKRCTYVTREERPLAAAGHAKVTRL